MITRTTGMAVLAAALIAGTGATIAWAGQTAERIGPLTCHIESSNAGNMVSLQGIVHADNAASGSYRFIVESAGRGGHSSTSQSGQFSVGPGEDARLSKVMLGGNGAYDARLQIEANGMTLECKGTTADSA